MFLDPSATINSSCGSSLTRKSGDDETQASLHFLLVLIDDATLLDELPSRPIMAHVVGLAKVNISLVW